MEILCKYSFYVPQLPLYGGLKEQIKLTSQGKFDLTNIIL